MANKKKTGLVIFIIIMVLAVAVGAWGVAETIAGSKAAAEEDGSSAKEDVSKILNDLSGSPSKKTSKTPKTKGEYIAKLVINGEIGEDNQTYNQKWILRTIEKLKKDKNNKGTILFINSPGGAVYQADEVYLALIDYKASGKKLYAYCGPMAASGGYYIACAADYISANRNCLTGSIGVIAGQSIDLTGLLEKYGVKYTTITAGKNKNMGNINQPLTEEQKQIMQSIADECYEQFTGIVAKSRKLPKATIYNLADGRVYTANQAKKNGLIDAVETFEDASKKMQKALNAEAASSNDSEDDTEAEDGKEKKNAKQPKEYSVVTYEYERTQSFYNYFMGEAKGLKKTMAGSAVPDAVEKIISSETTYPAFIYMGN